MAKYKKIKAKTVDEWLRLRQPLIGGSEIGAVLGISPWESRYELYLRKKGDIEPKVENLAMRLGHKLENAVAELLQEEAGYQIIKNTAGNLIYISEDYDFAEASPDRIGYLPHCPKKEENKCIIEIKTTQKAIDEDSIPEHWICQLQWYMGIVGIHYGVIAWLTGGRDFGFKEIPFDKDFFSFLIEEGRAFKQCLDNNIEPDAVTARDVAVRYPRHEDGKFTEVSEEVALACEKYKELKEKIKALEAEQETYEEAIKVAIGDSEGITYGYLKLATYKASKDGQKFDDKTFIAENPELASKYMKFKPGSRRLVLK